MSIPKKAPLATDPGIPEGSQAQLALDGGTGAAEALAALLADDGGGTERRVELRLGEDTVAADAAAKPRGEGLLVGKAAGLHGAEFRRE